MRGMGDEKKTLFKNTLMLYILRFSTYFFGFITVPYETRVLGPLVYGKVAAAMALMAYFRMLIDFGFLLSATQDVAHNHDDTKKVSVIFSAVQYAKVLLIILSAIILVGVSYFSPELREEGMFYFLFLLGTAINGLVPDFVYRGIQQMGPITFRVVISRVVFTVLIFVFLKSPADYMMIPLLNIFGSLLALVWALVYLKRNYGIGLKLISPIVVFENLKSSSGFFLSRIAGSLYTHLNVLILGGVAPASRGDYAAASKLLTTGQSGLGPISDSIYPYMTKNKDFKLIKKILVVFMPIITIGCAIAYIFADPLTKFVFGSEYVEAGAILKGMMPAAVLTLPDYLLGFPTMTALGITEQANYSVYFSSVMHIIALIIVYNLGMLNAVSLSWLLSLATAWDLAYRVYHVRKRWRELNKATS